MIRIFFLSLWLLSGLSAVQPDFIYLTWEADPTTSAVIRWGTTEPSKDAKIEKLSKVAELEKLKDDFFLQSLTLNGLEPGKLYHFQIDGDEHVYTFRTMPKDLSKITFVIGGDTYNNAKIFCDMNEQIVSRKPDFVVIGGDVAYTYRRSNREREKQMERWRSFFSDWHNTTAFVTGNLTPMLAIVGNHDVKGSKDPEVYKEELFYQFFRGDSYKRVDFGNYLSLLLLDSGHNTSINGKQTAWLKNQLEQTKKQPYKFAIYHVGAYPSVYPFSGSKSKKIRDNWSPLFEKNQVQLAFENHNHAYKRTKIIKDGKVADEGVVYLGDGSWGVPVRTPKTPKQLWYLEKSASKNAVFFLTLDKTEGLVEAMDGKGEVFDSSTFKPIKN